jgi:hypothetical protein
MILRVIATVSCAAALAVPMAVPASAAATTYRTSALTYACELFPGLTPQPATLEARFDAPDSVPSGTTATPAALGGVLRFDVGPHAIMTAYGYDGFRGSATLGLSATGAALSGPSATGLTVPERIYPAGGAIEVPFEQVAGSAVPSLTAGAPGPATVALTTATFFLEYHKKANGQWTPWTMRCPVWARNPPQNTAFSPSIPVT